MSSLLQHNGRVRGGKVELFFYLVKKDKDWEKYNGPDAYEPNPESTTFTDPCEIVTCPETGLKVPKLYRIWRRPAGMWGPWVVFRYNGTEHVPDLSLPISVLKLPKDAEPLGDEETLEYWRS